MRRIISILLIEDDIIDQMEIRRTLDSRGVLCHLRVASNGEDALAILTAANYKPDIILVETELPRMSGFELAARIKSDPACAASRIFILSSVELEEEKALASKIGVSGVIQKPLRLESSASKGVFNLMIDLMNA